MGRLNVIESAVISQSDIDLFEDLDVNIQDRIDIVLNKSSGCGGNWGGGGGWACTGSCAGCKS